VFIVAPAGRTLSRAGSRDTGPRCRGCVGCSAPQAPVAQLLIMARGAYSLPMGEAQCSGALFTWRRAHRFICPLRVYARYHTIQTRGLLHWKHCRHQTSLNVRAALAAKDSTCRPLPNRAARRHPANR
jgi:hypothetical protein